MALIFSPSVTILMANGAVLQNLMPYGGQAATAITIYSGVQPSAATIVSNWSTYNSTNASLLVHFNSIVWALAANNSSAVDVSTTPSATPINTGTATWAILWTNMAVTTAQLASGTLPTPLFFVAPVSNINGTGIVRFTSNSMTSGTAVTIADAGILTNFI